MTRALRRYAVASEIKSHRGIEYRLMKRCWTRKGAIGWAKFYTALVTRLLGGEGYPEGFDHRYLVSDGKGWIEWA